MLGTDIASYIIKGNAPAIRAILVMNNVKHFRFVKGLVIENWAG